MRATCHITGVGGAVACLSLCLLTLGCAGVATPTPGLVLSTTTLDFGETTSELELTVTNTGDPPVTWAVSTEEDWISASPTSGSGSATVTVTVDRSALDTPTSEGVLTITTSTGSRFSVQVSLEGATDVTVTPTSLSFDGTASTRTFAIANTGDGTLSWFVSSATTWISVTPTSGSGDTTITVSIDRSNLSPGTHAGVVSVATSGGAFSVSVQVEVSSAPTVSSVTASPTRIGPGESATVTAVASDPDGDPITYAWSATGGSVSGSGATATYTAPATAGTYTVTCAVNDGSGKLGVGTATIVVYSTGDMEVVITDAS